MSFSVNAIQADILGKLLAAHEAGLEPPQLERIVDNGDLEAYHAEAEALSRQKLITLHIKRGYMTAGHRYRLTATGLEVARSVNV